MLPLSKSDTNRSPALSKASGANRLNPRAKVLRFPFEKMIFLAGTEAGALAYNASLDEQVASIVNGHRFRIREPGSKGN